MQLEEITIRVDPEAARIYREASEEQRMKYDVILALRLKALTGPRRSLREVMDQMSDRAQARGLTPDILQAILNERQ